MIISRIIIYLKQYGLISVFKKVIEKINSFLGRKVKTNFHKKLFLEILEKHKGENLIIFLSPIPWNVPLFQRPQHIAENLAKEGYLYFYCTENNEVNGFKKIADSCYITNRQDIILKNVGKVIIHTYSTDIRNLRSIIKHARKKNCIFLYEYIDELDEELVGKISKYTYLKHNSFLEDEENSIIIASADTLFQKVLNYRSKNLALVTNGVEYEHFHIQKTISEIPIEIKYIVGKNKPIIGYFGAFATWFDYELVVRLAIARPEYEILLIGWNYDNSILKYNLGQYENITVIGPINYKELPKYAIHFSVSTIPFVLNQITESTSPIKLFEYMALGKPIVTTNLLECRKYESVLIGEDIEDFIVKIDKALMLSNDLDYLSLLDMEARENTWEAKAKEIKKMIPDIN